MTDQDPLNDTTPMPEQMPTDDASPPPLPQKDKERHGCLTAWLILMAIGAVFGAINSIGGGQNMPEGFPPTPAWANVTSVLLSMANIVLVIALFKWKKWGFWGICATNVAAGVIMLGIGLPPYIAAVCLLGPLILYGVFHIGDKNKGWPQLD